MFSVDDGICVVDASVAVAAVGVTVAIDVVVAVDADAADDVVGGVVVLCCCCLVDIDVRVDADAVVDTGVDVSFAQVSEGEDSGLPNTARGSYRGE